METIAKSDRSLFSGIQLFQAIDVSIWIAVFLFFIGSSLINNGDIPSSLLGAAGIVFVMFVVGTSIEVLIETLRDVKGIGTLVGFITNGPEALCLIVGLVAGDVLFAASTPLGSNIMNPVMLITSALITGKALSTIRTEPRYTAICITVTAIIAVSFFFVPQKYYLIWMAVALPASAILFFKRPDEIQNEESDEDGVGKFWFFPALIVLLASGYLLDPIVSFTAEHSRAPKGVIGFFVLSALTSWPEFKSALSLFKRNMVLASILNITVSNITNLWLAIVGILVFLFM